MLAAAAPLSHTSWRGAWLSTGTNLPSYQILSGRLNQEGLGVRVMW